jgi:retinol-binding protein 3
MMTTEQPKTAGAQPDMPITVVVRSQVIALAAKKIREHYVFPDVAEKVASSILSADKADQYQHLKQAQAFAEALTKAIQTLGNDKHFKLRFSPDVLEDDIPLAERDKQKPSQVEIAKSLEINIFNNFGVEKFERLPTNIALLQLNHFADPQIGGEVIAAAMTLVSSAEALIVDLRKNGGGYAAMAALISSYLFDPEPVHLNDLYFRFNNQTRQFWTHAYVPGKRFGPDKPIYVLTSNFTFSAAEEFSNNLQTLKRATIIGETTGGGANPGDWFKVGEHFNLFISTGKAINPITQDNWEGKGVLPDIAVPAEQALLTAQILAMQPIIEKLPETWERTNANKILAELQGKLDSLKAGM